MFVSSWPTNCIATFTSGAKGTTASSGVGGSLRWLLGGDRERSSPCSSASTGLGAMFDADDSELTLCGVCRLIDDPSATAAAAPLALEEDKVKLTSSVITQCVRSNYG